MRKLLIKCLSPQIFWKEFSIHIDVKISYMLHQMSYLILMVYLSVFHCILSMCGHELLSSNPLHQVIKVTYKDHIVTCVTVQLREVEVCELKPKV